jgi:hypothetical protein
MVEKKNPNEITERVYIKRKSLDVNMIVSSDSKIS